MAVVPIDQKVRQLCRETGEPDYKNYDTILSHIRGALIDLNLYVIPSVKTFTMEADHLGNLKWPCSCVRPLIISLIRNGKSCNLHVDSGVASSNGCGCRNISDAENLIDSYVLGNEFGTDIFYLNEFGVKRYGMGFNDLNVVNHDQENRLSHLRCKVMKGDKFEFTCITDGVSDGVTHIPVEAEVAIDEWVFWKYYRRSNLGISDRGRERYQQEFMRLRKFYNDTTIEDWIRAVVKR